MKEIDGIHPHIFPPSLKTHGVAQPAGRCGIGFKASKKDMGLFFPPFLTPRSERHGLRPFPRVGDGQRRGMEPLPRVGAGCTKAWNRFQGIATASAAVWNQFQGPFPAGGGQKSSSKARRSLRHGLEAVPKRHADRTEVWNQFHGHFQPATGRGTTSTGVSGRKRAPNPFQRVATAELSSYRSGCAPCVFFRCSLRIQR